MVGPRSPHVPTAISLGRNRNNSFCRLSTSRSRNAPGARVGFLAASWLRRQHARSEYGCYSRKRVAWIPLVSFPHRLLVATPMGMGRKRVLQGSPSTFARSGPLPTPHRSYLSGQRARVAPSAARSKESPPSRPLMVAPILDGRGTAFQRRRD